MKRSILFTVYILVLVAIGVAALEWWILPRSGGYLPRRTRLMGFHAIPGTMIDDAEISAIGFAGDAPAPDKPESTIRILTLGGSAFFNRRLTERIGRHLNLVSEAPVELVGGALRTHTTMSSVLKYRLLSEYDFDYVLIYHGINDLWANHATPDQYDPDYAHLGAYYRRGPLLDRSLILRGLYNRFFYDRKVPYSSPTRRDENAAGFAAVTTFRRNLETLVGETRADGAVPILITFAWSIPEHYTLEAFLARTVGYNNPTNYDRFGAELWGSPDYVREGLDLHDDVIRKLAAERDVLLIDQERLMGKDLVWYGDICHYSEEGTERFAENITLFFLEHGLIR